MTTILALDDVCFSYGTGFELRIDSLLLESSEAICLYGPSGCGKSTLLNLIAGELIAKKGSISVCGEEMGLFSKEARKAHRIRNIGFVFQDFPLINYLNALENVLLPYRINPALDLSAFAQERARQLLAAFGLQAKEMRRPSQLSQGEQQRVAIARSLITQPTLILADEPTAGLDPERSQQVMDFFLNELSERSVALVCVTHDSSVRARFRRCLSFSEDRSDGSFGRFHAIETEGEHG